MMPTPGHQIYHWPHVTLTFDFLKPKVDHSVASCPGPVDHLCRQSASKLVHLSSKYCGHKFDQNKNYRRDLVKKFGKRQMNGRTDRQTDRRDEDIMPPLRVWPGEGIQTMQNVVSVICYQMRYLLLTDRPFTTNCKTPVVICRQMVDRLCACVR